MMEEIWIMGLGQFGLLAVQKLSKGRKERHFVLVDPIQENLSRGAGPNRILEQTDGVTFLKQHLQTGNGPDWIIPALPVHLAAEYCLVRLGPGRIRRRILPPEIEPHLPNPICGSEGNIYVSHADFKCPADCAEPRDICTVTQKIRKQNMYEILGNLRLTSFKPFVIRSHQLGPGIGGYRPKQLFRLIDQVEQAKGDLFVSTACRCHGVVTGLERLR